VARLRQSLLERRERRAEHAVVVVVDGTVAE
jgi:hypothetical protein